MDKTIQLELNKYSPIPPSLCDPLGATLSRPDVPVDLAQLYHHYYLDTYGRGPPSPDPAHFEHVRFLTPGIPFRFLGDGLGASTSARRSRSTELGQAFFRWFLHQHLEHKISDTPDTAASEHSRQLCMGVPHVRRGFPELTSVDIRSCPRLLFMFFAS